MTAPPTRPMNSRRLMQVSHKVQDNTEYASKHGHHALTARGMIAWSQWPVWAKSGHRMRYSRISLARERTECGTVSPSALAALRLNILPFDYSTNDRSKT